MAASGVGQLAGLGGGRGLGEQRVARAAIHNDRLVQGRLTKLLDKLGKPRQKIGVWGAIGT